MITDKKPTIENLVSPISNHQSMIIINWPSGTYTCNLAADGNSVLTRKITIQK